MALGPPLVLSAAVHCSSTAHEGAVDSGADDAPVVESGGGSTDAGPSDAPPTKSVIQGVGSKCLTVCPMHLTCDPYKWKGFCTKPCMTDNDCQGTGDPPVTGVCGPDMLCYKACDPMTDPCTRQEWTCVGPPGHTYCDNFYDAHYYKPETGTGPGEAAAPGGDASDDAAETGTD
jgi:hypothetical protein